MPDEKKKRRRHDIRRLKLNELSLVDNPANQHAHVSIFKRADPVPTVAEAEPTTVEMFAKRREATHEAVEALAIEKAKTLGCTVEQAYTQIVMGSPQLQRALAR